MCIAELRKRASEADAKLKRLYGRDRERCRRSHGPDAEGSNRRAQGDPRSGPCGRKRGRGWIERLGPNITAQALRTFARRASGCGARAAAAAATTSAHSRNASKWTRKRFASWDRKAYCCTRSSPRHARKRRVLEGPVLYRSGAPDKIRTCDLCLRRTADHSVKLPFLRVFRSKTLRTQRKHHPITRTFRGRFPMFSAASR